MIRRRFLISLVELADLVIVFTTLLATLALTGGSLDVQGARGLLETPMTVRNFLLPGLMLVLWHAVLTAAGLYGSYRLAPASHELRDLAIAVSIAVAPMYLLGGWLPLARVDLVFVFLLWTLTFMALTAERQILRAIGRVVRRLGRNLRDVVVVGDGDSARRTADMLAQQVELGCRVAAVIDCASPETTETGMRQDLDALLDGHGIDEVLFVLPVDRSQPLLARLIALCEEQGVTVRVLANVSGPRRTWTRVDTMVGQPVVTIATVPSDRWLLAVKRGIDLAGAACGLVLAAPILLVIAAAVRLDSPGPIVFRQQRVGLNRRRFWAYKFRTMVADAERMQDTLEQRNEAQGPVFKIRDDPRITRVGRWLRQTSLDELPQLVNVLKGEMSLVGPRPLPLRDVDRMDVRWHKRRFSVKPGITCLWQVKSRTPQFDEWIRSDMEYIDNWSLILDLKILALTVPAVLSRQGAH
jgi:exopolysaccharide biosynthesis polyprenyl glycosylphosphotransferase